MDDDSKAELRALVVGFLQQSLQENPHGFSIHEFERFFPERCDEPRDWYKRYHKKNALEALECIQDAVKVQYNSRLGATFISLDLKSDKVDSHLVDLIKNQKPSSKKRNLKRPSSRALSSFSLNRQYSDPYSSRNNNYRQHSLRLNHGQQYRNESLFIKKGSPPAPISRPPPSIYSKNLSPSTRVAPADPRAARGGFSPMVPPQIKHASAPSYPRPSSASTSAAKPSTPTSQNIPKPPASKPAVDAPLKAKEEDPVMAQKKSYLRQRLLSLLTRKFSEIKMIHLRSLYQLEFEEDLVPAYYEHEGLTTLMQDPMICTHIQINYKGHFPTISAKCTNQVNGKENIVSGDSNKKTSNIDPKEANTEFSSNKPNVISYSRAKLQAIDPFNVKTMIQSLEPVGTVKEPPLKSLKVDDVVKYKTMRIIFKSPDSTLRLDDWETSFEQESRLKIRIRDYGFKTLLEFFKHLAIELPIKVQLNSNDEWVAVADISLLSEWLHDQLSKGQYRAITAIEMGYELVAYPIDRYTYITDYKDLMSQEYHPSMILNIKRSNVCVSMWIQLRTPKYIEDQLSVEASMTCYEDYKEKNLLTVSKYFIKPGFPCAVYDTSQQRWCRALILKAPEVIDKNHEINVLLVDYAITRTCVISQLLCLMKTHLKLPVGPIYSKLSGVSDEADLGVQQHTKIVLQEYTKPPVILACKFVKPIPSNEPDYLPKHCFEVTLVDTRHGKDCNIADDITRSLAVKRTDGAPLSLQEASQIAK